MPSGDISLVNLISDAVQQRRQPRRQFAPVLPLKSVPVGQAEKSGAEHVAGSLDRKIQSADFRHSLARLRRQHEDTQHHQK
jgi:hypothetical protein